MKIKTKRQPIKSLNVTIATLSFTHALVDTICAMLVFSIFHIHPFSNDTFIKIAVIYNILAFGLQPVCGLLSDHFIKPRYCVFLGTFCMIIALMLLYHSWIMVVIAGIGNAFFHVGGGCAALDVKHQKTAASGFFVSPGVVGLAIGTYIGNKGVPVIWPFALLLAVVTGALMFMTFPGEDNKEAVENHTNLQIEKSTVIILLLFTSVAIRSFVGFAAGNLWQGQQWAIFFILIATATGKALGGIVADWLGWQKTGTGALILATILFISGHNVIWCSAGGILLLQMTMPVTLIALYQVLPGKPGQTFGLCCLALIVGALPAIKPFKVQIMPEIAVISGMIISLVALSSALHLLAREKQVSFLAYSE